MSNVEHIQSQLRQLSRAELIQVRDWLEDFLEDQLKFTLEFEAAILQSERELALGLRPRVLHP